MILVASYSPTATGTIVTLRLDAARFPNGFDAFDISLRFDPTKVRLEPPTAASYAGEFTIPNNSQITAGVVRASSVNFEGRLSAQNPIATLNFTNVVPASFSFEVTQLNVGTVTYVSPASAITLNSNGTSSQLGAEPGTGQPPPDNTDPTGGSTAPPRPPVTDATVKPVALADADKLGLAELLAFFPQITSPLPISQRSLVSHTLLGNEYDQGQNHLKLLPKNQSISSSLSEDAFFIGFTLPANTGLDIFGPSTIQTPAASRAYYNGLVDLALPGNGSYAQFLKTAILTVTESPGTANWPTKLVTIEGNAGGEPVSINGRVAARELVVLNLFAAGNLPEVRVNHTSHVLVVGNGRVKAEGTEAIALVGDAGNQILVGGVANDYLAGGGGADILIGGPGSDIFHINAMGHLTIFDFTPADRIWFTMPGVKSLAELANKVTLGEVLPSGLRFFFGPDMSVTLTGLKADFPFSDTIFIFQ